MDNFNRKIYSVVFGAVVVVGAKAVAVDGVVVVVNDGVVVVCAVVDVLFVIDDFFVVVVNVVFDSVVCIGCDGDVVWTVDVKQRIS